MSCVHRRDVGAVDGDAAALAVVEAQQQVDDGRLAGAGAADEADLLARADMEVEVLDDARTSCRSGSATFSNLMSPLTLPIGLAPGASETTRGSEIEEMPSRTVPMFSNSDDISHITHWLMPWKRMTRPSDTASAPGVIEPCSHSQMPMPPTADEQQRVEHRRCRTLSTVNSRICRWTVSRNWSIASLA